MSLPGQDWRSPRPPCCAKLRASAGIETASPTSVFMKSESRTAAVYTPRYAISQHSCSTLMSRRAQVQNIDADPQCVKALEMLSFIYRQQLLPKNGHKIEKKEKKGTFYWHAIPSLGALHAD